MKWDAIWYNLVDLQDPIARKIRHTFPIMKGGTLDNSKRSILIDFEVKTNSSRFLKFFFPRFDSHVNYWNVKKNIKHDFNESPFTGKEPIHHVAHLIKIITRRTK